MKIITIIHFIHKHSWLTKPSNVITINRCSCLMPCQKTSCVLPDLPHSSWQCRGGCSKGVSKLSKLGENFLILLLIATTSLLHQHSLYASQTYFSYLFLNTAITLVPYNAELWLQGLNCLVIFFFFVLLFYVHGKHLRSCRDGQLT